jgi:hypothetical protein
MIETRTLEIEVYRDKEGLPVCHKADGTAFCRFFSSEFIDSVYCDYVCKPLELRGECFIPSTDCPLWGSKVNRD